MAILHQATLIPTKLELVDHWLPGQPWTGDSTGPSELIGNFRFDDPAGEVGLETLLLRLGDGRTVQVPLTYRDAPLDGAERALIGTLSHSVLGERWVYDGCADPVFVTALATAVVTGGVEAELAVKTDKGIVIREPTTRVRGSGTGSTPATADGHLATSTDDTATTIHTGDLELIVHRVPDPATGAGDSPDALTLTGTWPGVDQPVVLVSARTR